MGSRFLRAAVMAGTLLAVVGPTLGLAPSALAQSDPATATASASSTAYDIGWPRDVSWPQCSGSYPAAPAYAVVGVNGGLAFSLNPCLVSELAWAGGAGAGLYANTGNPGPALSSHWPLGQALPMACDPASPDSAACAYDYGYNAAADSYTRAQAAFTTLGLAQSPAGSAWWLDVETSNSWQDDVSLNVANLQGAVDYLESVANVASVGFYSTQYQWDVITGGTSTFAAHPSWVAGASNALDASVACGGPGFTGGGVVLAQYPSAGFDADVRCNSVAQVPTTISMSPASASVGAGGSRLLSATGLDQFGQPLYPQPSFTWSVSGGGTISTGGLFTAGAALGGPFTVTASSGSISGTASVTVTAAPVLTTIAVAPSTASTQPGGSLQFSATGLDQSGQPLASPPTFTWSVSGGGTISTSGLFTAGSTAGGPFTVTASSGTLDGTTSVTVAAVGDVARAVGTNASFSIAHGLTAQPAGGSYALDTTNDAISVAVTDAAGHAIGANVSFSYSYTPANIVSLALDTYDSAKKAWNFNATCANDGTATVAVTARSTLSTATATTGALTLTCADALTATTSGSFTAAATSTTVVPNGTSTITVKVLDDNKLPAPDGTPVVAVSSGVGNVIGSGGTVGSATTSKGAATFTYLAPANAGSGTVTVSVADATPVSQAIAFTIGGVAPATGYAAASSLGVTSSGPFTTATKLPRIGAFVTVRLSFGAAAAGQTIGVYVAARANGVWSGFAALTSRVADSRGNVYFHWRASRASWWSVYGQLSGARSNAVQVRWM